MQTKLKIKISNLPEKIRNPVRLKLGLRTTNPLTVTGLYKANDPLVSTKTTGAKVGVVLLGWAYSCF